MAKNPTNEKKLISDVLDCIERARNKYCIVNVIQGISNEEYNEYVLKELYYIRDQHSPDSDYESMGQFIKRLSQYFLIVNKVDEYLSKEYFSIICEKIYA